MKGHFEKVCLKSKCSTDSLEVPQASTSATRAGDPLYFSDDGETSACSYGYCVAFEQTFD